MSDEFELILKTKCHCGSFTRRVTCKSWLNKADPDPQKAIRDTSETIPGISVDCFKMPSA